MGKNFKRKLTIDKAGREGLKTLLKEIEARREAATENPPTPGMNREKGDPQE